MKEIKYIVRISKITVSRAKNIQQEIFIYFIEKECWLKMGEIVGDNYNCHFQLTFKSEVTQKKIAQAINDFNFKYAKVVFRKESD